MGCGGVGSAGRKAVGAGVCGADGKRDSEKVECRGLRTAEEAGLLVVSLLASSGPV